MNNNRNLLSLLNGIPTLKKKTKENSDANSTQSNNKTTNNIGVAAGTSEIAREHARMAGEQFKKLDENMSWKEQRQQLEPAGLKKVIKEQAFGENTMIKDRYSDNMLVMERIDAKTEFGIENYTEHQAHADHITPLKKIYEDRKNDAWTSVEDIKEIANADENFAIINGKMNYSKGDRTNSEYLDYIDRNGRENEVLPKYRELMLEDEINSNNFLNDSFNKRKVKNVVTTGHRAGVEAAKSGAIFGGAISIVQNAVAVAKGEKHAEGAAIDVVKDTASAAVLGYGTGALGSTISHTLSYSSNTILQSLSKTNLPSQIAVAALETGKTMKKFVCGEIDGTQCMTELGEKGTGMIAASYGAVAGQALIPIPMVGGMIGSMVGYAFASSYYNGLVTIMQDRKLAREERIRIEAECKELLDAIKIYRQEIEQIAEAYFADYKNVFDTAFVSIGQALQTGDADGVIMGANMITQKLGGETQYNNMDEFDDFMNNEDLDFVL